MGHSSVVLAMRCLATCVLLFLFGHRAVMVKMQRGIRVGPTAGRAATAEMGATALTALTAATAAWSACRVSLAMSTCSWLLMIWWPLTTLSRAARAENGAVTVAAALVAPVAPAAPLTTGLSHTP